MIQDEEKYNGWTNYQTWVTASWLDDDEVTQDYWRERARKCREEAPASSQVEEGIWTIDQAARFALAHALDAEVTEGSPVTAKVSLYADLLGAALLEVNWHEIAEHWLYNLDT